MQEPPHSATMPSTPLNTAACMTLVPTSMSSVVAFPPLSIYVTFGMFFASSLPADGGPALRNPPAGVEPFSSGVSARQRAVYREDKQRAREGCDEGRIAGIRRRHPCRADGGSYRHLCRSLFPAAVGR